MRALLADGRLHQDYPEPLPGAGEALIRLRLAGICATDLAILRGYAGFTGVLGHEFVGTVAACPDGPVWIGQRVVGSINRGCGHCGQCRAGLSNHCVERRVLGIRHWDGVFADYCLMPIANLYPVPASMPDHVAVFTEPVAAALRILEQIPIQPTYRVTIIGDGKLGLLVAQVLRLTGCQVQLVGRHPERWSLAPGVGAVLEQDLACWGQEDLVVECSGSGSGLLLAQRLVAPQGRVVLKTTLHNEVVGALASLVVNEVQLVGSRCGPFAPALRLLEQGLVRVEPLIVANYPLSDVTTALAVAGDHALKVLLTP